MIVALGARDAVGRDRDAVRSGCPLRVGGGHGVPARRAHRRVGARNDPRHGADLGQPVHFDLTGSRPASGRNVVSDGGFAVAEGQRSEDGEERCSDGFHDLSYVEFTPNVMFKAELVAHLSSRGAN